MHVNKQNGATTEKPLPGSASRFRAHLLRACARIDTSSSLNMDGSSSVANVNGGSCASAVPQAEWKVMAKDLFAGTVRLVLADDQTLLAAA